MSHPADGKTTFGLSWSPTDKQAAKGAWQVFIMKGLNILVMLQVLFLPTEIFIV
jgi:hypothetical protein